MCGCEFNIAAAGSAVAGTVLGHFSSSSDTSAIYHSALVVNTKMFLLNTKLVDIANLLYQHM